MIGSILSVLDFFWENNSGSSSSHAEVKLPEPAPTLTFSSTTRKITPPKINPYEQLHQQLQDLSYREEDVKRLLVPLEQPDSFTATEAWFNDILVNDYFQQLAAQYSGVEVISSLMNQCIPPLPDRFRNEQKYDVWKKKLSESPLVFWPMHQNNHWHLIIIDNTSDPSVYILDGFNSRDEGLLTGSGFELASAIRPLQRGRAEHISGEFISVAKQENAYDCGPVICFYAKVIAAYYVRHQQLPNLSELEKVDYTGFRKNIAEALVALGTSLKSVNRPSRL
ncbi:hypothetical protein CC99x_012295 [Candidatus Berkiella cookevillensis]|uniref:Ubiquitin-like protease family profile domain-containing protein n=1 Tax=Candidatus Berkiella cookevillensis TaxID=437022 RepID=A0A0Q9YGR7_9GAMM|nr:Ulp1 family isopeptidase [Candidatus Berkiella cookevillensis]MCS5709677.1 hypothetical protein [Candidatus Berkiella cookevillensis]